MSRFIFISSPGCSTQEGIDRPLALLSSIFESLFHLLAPWKLRDMLPPLEQQP
jgi:hypothetical protein